MIWLLGITTICLLLLIADAAIQRDTRGERHD